MKRTILFVDDDQNILDGFRTLLYAKRREWTCRFALSAREGLEYVDKEQFDVVIADMRMPGMDGADFLKEVEQRQPGAVRMILSGYSEMSTVLKSVRHAHQFLSKPCSSETVMATIRRVTDLKHILDNEAVRAIVTGLQSLPAMPDLYIQIERELEGSDPDLRRIARLVEKDVGMSATLMRVVNSSFFGFYEKITSPAHAVALLGVEALKGLVLGVHLLSEADASGVPGYSIAKLWEHSLQTAYVAKVVAGLEGGDDAFMEGCFIAGILHDIGKLVFVTQMPEAYLPVVEQARQGKGPVLSIERRELGVSHAEVGAYLAGLWGFKKEVVEAVNEHHTPGGSAREFCMAFVVHAADALQHEIAQGGGDYVFPSIDLDWLEGVGKTERYALWRETCRSYLEAK
jgi:putative nucleotidyltransferase with HDIG domain